MVRPGDFFVTRNNSLLSDLINFFQRLRASDGKACFSHAGFFTDQNGTSFEALWKVREYNFWEEHDGDIAIIARHECMMPTTFARHYREIRATYGGRIYPAYRLLFHISTALAQWAPAGRGVCSEITMHLAHMCELSTWYRSATPDDVADWMCDPMNPYFTVVASGLVVNTS